MAPPKLTKKTLQGILKEANRQKALQDEYKGHYSATVTNAVEKYSLNNAALKQVIKLERQEPTKAQDYLRELIRLGFMAGLFDQFDAFDNLAGHLEQILEHIKKNDNGKGGGKKDATLDDLTGEADDSDEPEADGDAGSDDADGTSDEEWDNAAPGDDEE